MPDLFHYCFTGIKVNEFTDASTSQMLDPAHARLGATDLVAAFGLPDEMLGTIVQPGTVLGPLRASVARRPGWRRCRSIAPATHDTGRGRRRRAGRRATAGRTSARGTWSLMGVELAEPLINERRPGATTSPTKAASAARSASSRTSWACGWCRSAAAPGSAAARIRLRELAELAEAAKPFVAVVDPDDTPFLSPGDMPRRSATSAAEPASERPTARATVRLCLESLALTYRRTLDRLEECTGRRIRHDPHRRRRRQNALLYQMTADASGRRSSPARSRRPPPATSPCRRWRPAFWEASPTLAT